MTLESILTKDSDFREVGKSRLFGGSFTSVSSRDVGT